MSAKEYREVYPLMTEEEKKLMYELFMSGVNNDGHSWVAFGEVERVVGLIIQGRVRNE
jgi:hypothetical protein